MLRRDGIGELPAPEDGGWTVRNGFCFQVKIGYKMQGVIQVPIPHHQEKHGPY